MPKTAEAILANYETKTMKAKLLEYPALIQEQKAKVRKLRDELSDNQEILQAIEASIIMEIADEVDPNTGKARFSNDKTRSGELARRKQQNEHYKQARDNTRRVEHKLGEAQDELDALQDKYKSYRYVVRLTAEELALIAGDEESEEAVEYAPREPATATQPY